MVEDCYVKREHTLIKHKLLKAYIEKLFMIIGMAQSVIWFVDCFAGPWKIEEEDSDLKGTSISLSADIMQNCQKILRRDYGRDVKFKALYIEKDQSAYQRLKDYLTDKSTDNIEFYHMHGDFHDLRPQILNIVGDREFVFFFVDPTGWKNCIEPKTLQPLLERGNSEFLINFMYDFINRTFPIDRHKEDMVKISGKELDFTGLSPLDREELTINAYRDHLQKISVPGQDRLRTAYVKIKDPIKSRTKYHLVYLTRHPLGVVKFFESSQDISMVQTKVREQAKREREEEKTKQLDLFRDQDTTPKKPVGDEIKDIKDYFLNYLTDQPKHFGLVEMADMLENTGWFIKDIQEAFKQLQNDGKVKNIDAKRKRPANPIHFRGNNDRGERLIKVGK